MSISATWTATVSGKLGGSGGESHRSHVNARQAGTYRLTIPCEQGHAGVGAQCYAVLPALGQQDGRRDSVPSPSSTPRSDLRTQGYRNISGLRATRQKTGPSGGTNSRMPSARLCGELYQPSAWHQQGIDWVVRRSRADFPWSVVPAHWLRKSRSGN